MVELPSRQPTEAKGSAATTVLGESCAEARHHLFGADLGLELVAKMHRLPGADRSLVQTLGAGTLFDLRMNGNRGHRLHGAGKTQILAEAEHRFHAGIGAGRKIDAGQQFAAVGRRVFNRRGNALAALAEGSLLWPVAIRRAFSLGCAPDPSETTTSGPSSSQRSRGRLAAERSVQAQSSFWAFAGARLRRQPLHHFIQRVQREIDNGAVANAHIFAQRRQKRRAHRLHRIAAGQNRRNEKRPSLSV